MRFWDAKTLAAVLAACTTEAERQDVLHSAALEGAYVEQRESEVRG